MKLVLSRNNFQFNGNHYLQIRGTAIGTKMAVGFANNYVAFFERLYVYLYKLQPSLWLRFIDDVFMIWKHGEDELLEFLEFLNSRVESIKFTITYSKQCVNFLDTKVKIVDGKLETDLYSKPTDSHSYLLYDSAHPQRCKDSIPYGQFLRIRRICSLNTDFKDHILRMTVYFLQRDYPMKLLEEAAILAESKDRNELLKDKLAKDDDKIDKVLLITTYNPNFHDLRHIVYDNWEMLGKSPATDFLFEKKLMCGYRRPKNIKDILVRAEIPYKEGDGAARGVTQAETTQLDLTTHTQSVDLRNSVGATEITGPEDKGVEKQTTKQKSILDYLFPIQTGINTNATGSGNLAEGTSSDTDQRPREANLVSTKVGKQLTARKNRGFNFCNRIPCRYCPLLNKTGEIKSKVTGKVYSTMKIFHVGVQI
jgi:hypothetical protein